LVDKYIDMIDSIEQEIARLKASLTPAEAAEVEQAEQMMEPDAETPQPDAAVGKTCPQCGAVVEADALFCNKCGAQL